MIGVGLGITKTRGNAMSRASFASQLTTIMGAAPLAGYLTDMSDVLTSTDPWNGGTWTADASMAGQITAQGRGFTRALVSASSRYVTRPDAANLSFGNGTTDSPFTLFFFGSVADTAAVRALVAKTAASNVEYRLIVNSADLLQMILTDVGQVNVAATNSNAPVTQGSPHLYWATYSGVGGSSAANGITLGVDSATISQAALTDAGYVAMGNLTAPLDVGAMTNHTASFMDGAASLAGVAVGAASLATMANVTSLCSQYFGAP